ncbi:hypothetical protein OESDEN_12393 [Oesophagostomum dentatum]|uniref:Uncharacterized protein n=1 Tax=Oesophagostomum dentatum TaxID=61180 RepID=A0A0B1SS86_OESDE|nr:hypothetical protein OESDEN_12393 [Oesophagostomum dentatum]
MIHPSYSLDRDPPKCLSDPIVTPVTDEFPSEESRLWVAPKEVGAEKDQASVRKDYYADGNVHKGDKRIVSDPIVTPCTDEYPTEKDEKAVIKREVKIKPALGQKHKPKTEPKTYSPTTSTGFSGTCTQTSNDRSLRRAKLVRSNELVEARAGAGKQPETAPTEQSSRRKSTASKETTRGRRRKARKFKHTKKEKIDNVIETVTKVPTPSPKTPRAKKTPVAN